MRASGRRPWLGLLILALAAVPTSEPRADPFSDLRGARTVVRLDYDDSPILEVLQDLAEQGGFKVVVRDSVDREARVTVRRGDVSIASALFVLSHLRCLSYGVPGKKKLVVRQWSDLCGLPAIVSLDPEVSVPNRIDTHPPLYPELAKQRLFEGKLRIEVEITERGAVYPGALVQCDLHHYVDGPADVDAEVCGAFYAACVKAMRQWRYEPPWKKDRAVPARFLIKAGFQLNPKVGGP